MINVWSVGIIRSRSSGNPDVHYQDKFQIGGVQGQLTWYNVQNIYRRSIFTLGIYHTACLESAIGSELSYPQISFQCPLYSTSLEIVLPEQLHFSFVYPAFEPPKIPISPTYIEGI